MNKPKKTSAKYANRRAEIDKAREDTRSQRRRNKLLALATFHGTKNQ